MKIITVSDQFKLFLKKHDSDKKQKLLFLLKSFHPPYKIMAFDALYLFDPRRIACFNKTFRFGCRNFISFSNMGVFRTLPIEDFL